MANEWAGFRASFVTKPEQSGEVLVDEHQTLEARLRGRQRNAVKRDLPAARDANRLAAYFSAQALSRFLGHRLRRCQRQAGLACRLQHRAGQWMPGVLLDARGGAQHVLLVESGHADDLAQRGFAVGQRTRLVEDQRAARVDPLEDRWLPND